MANRYPLVIDTLDANKIKELQTGDNLNLADNSIVGVQNITALGTIEAAVLTVNGNRVVAQTFAQLSDTPGSFTGHADKFVAVKADASGLEFRPLSAFGDITTSGLNAGGNILPTLTNTYSIGSSTSQFANVYAVDLVGNIRAFNDDLIFNASTGKVPYAAIQGAPTNVSEFTNDVGFATTAGINQYITDYFAGSGGGALKVDITGSVYADDSTVLIDGIAGKIVGDIHYPTTGSITAGTKVQLGTTELTSTIEPPTANTGAIGTTTKRFGTGYFQNINASGNVTAATFNGTLNGILIGEQIGSVFGDDSTILVDGISGKVVGPIDSDSVAVGSLVPNTVANVDVGDTSNKFNNGWFAGTIDTDALQANQLRTSETKIALGSQAGNATQGNNSIAIGTNAGQTNQASTSIAIGANAGTTNQATGSIIINATGGALENTVNASFVVKPIRAQSNANYLKYNVGTGEITYEADAAGVFTGDLTGSVFADDSTVMVDGVNARHNFPNNVLGDLANVSGTAPTAGQVLKWDGSQWAPGTDATTGGAGTDADTLDGFDSPYFLAWANMTGTPTTLAGYGITDAVSATSTTAFTNKSGNISQWTNDSNYLTSVPAQSFASLTSKPTTIAGYGITDAFDGAYGSLSGTPTIPSGNQIIDWTAASAGTIHSSNYTNTVYANSDVDTHLNQANPTAGFVLSWSGTDYAWVDNAGYTDANVDTHLNQSNPTSGHVLSWNGSDYAWVAQSGGGGSLGAFTLTGSVMDTNDSSSITVTPAMVIQSDLTVENDVVVNNTVRANKLVSTAAGVPKFTSTTNIELNAGGAVIIGSSALRIKSFTTAQRDALTPSTGDVIYNSTLLKMQLRIGSAWKSISISDDIPTNNNQLTNGAGYLTTATDIHTFNITANGSSDYVFAQDTRYFPIGAENDPVLYVRRGETYHFVVNASGHPFQIRTSNGGSAYNTGVTNNGTQSGTVVWTVPMTAPSSVYYQCTAHSGMGNTINIVT